MLFNSFQFFNFYIAIFILYWSVGRNYRFQNLILLIASYFFYSCWDWRFLSLIWISTIVDYVCGMRIYSADSLKLKKYLLGVSVFVNLGILGFFKYFNFFSENLQILMNQIGFSVNQSVLNVILPVGISFYTFQTMSYTIDIYKGKVTPEKNLLNFALYVCFFPQLVAGPIERAEKFLPQVAAGRVFKTDAFYKGCFLIFIGLYQKVFVADNLAKIVDPVFSVYTSDGWSVLFALYAFAFQILCDFSGYSLIALGSAKCLGFNLTINFKSPYFSCTPSEFWTRWHISLSRWLRDYLYIPMGGNREGWIKTIRNLMITMTLGGLWHGAAWGFVLWGIYHGLLLIIYHAFERSGRIKSMQSNLMGRIFLRIILFHFICFGWLIFRAEGPVQIQSFAFSLINGWGSISENHIVMMKKIIFFVSMFLVFDTLTFVKSELYAFYKQKNLMKALGYLIIFYSILMYGVQGGAQFIYFQF